MLSPLRATLLLLLGSALCMEIPLRSGPAVASPVEERSPALDQMQARGQPTKEVVIFKPPSIKTKSTARELKLAKHLKASGARMFGAYWCSHCNSQKVAFGADAARLIRYVECAADGFDSERPLCQSSSVTGYPTWEINGKLYPGEKSLEALGELSGFTG